MSGIGSIFSLSYFTSRTTPQDSPLTVSLDWQYYRNLTKVDFARLFDFDDGFSRHAFWSNWQSFDLYFCGIKKTSDAALHPAWEAFNTDATAYMAAKNRRKVTRYRAVSARLFGDPWFVTLRAVRDSMVKTFDYIHED